MTTTLPIIEPPELERCRLPDDGCFGSLSTTRGHLPLSAMDVHARITGLVSHVELRQTFVNTLDTAIEATYIFPLPARAAVTRFRMKVGDRVVEGVIKERGEARQIYDDAIAAGHRAAITEEERSGVFTMRVGNLVPGDRAEVTLSLVGRVPFDAGEATFRFPLVVAPRYIPGEPLPGDQVGAGVEPDTDAVPDASRISPPVLLPGYPNPVRLGLRVDLDTTGLPLSNLRSSLHAVTTTGQGDHRRIDVRPGERLDRDFILRYTLGDDAVRTGLVVSPDGDGDEGSFMLTAVPPVTDAPDKPRDVVFVLDRSGSMGGWKMVAARRATARMVDSLSDRDRLAVWGFDNTMDSPRGFPGDALVDATDRNRFRAVEFLAGLEARGGTEMARPLELASELLAGGYQDRDKILVLVTDGQVGNEDQILRRLGSRLKNVRIFTLGIDRAVNEGFLRRLATLGGGACELVESEDRLDDVMDKVHRRIATPVVTEVAIEAAGLPVVAGSLVPRRKPDLFAGSAVVMYGRYRGRVSGGVAITGRDPAGDPWQVSLEAEAADNPAIARLWARAVVRDLEDRYVLGRGSRSELEKRIVDTSLRFSVLSRFTAFVAVDDSQVVGDGGRLTEVLQPVEMPDGWDMMSAPAAHPAGAIALSLSAPPTASFTEVGGLPPAPGAPAPAPMRGRSLAGKMRRGAPRVQAPVSEGRWRSEAEEEAAGGGAGGSHRASYLRRAGDIADRLTSATTAAHIKRAIGDLDALAEDLRSVGDATLADAVAELASDLRARLSGGDDPASMAADVAARLRKLDRPASATRRTGFWK